VTAAAGRAPRAARIAPAGLAALAAIAAGLLAEILLHVLEPQLSVTWGYAHLGRSSVRVALAVAVSIALPLGVAWAWRLPAAAKPPLAPSWRATIVAVLALWLALAALGLALPAFPLTLDALYFRRAVEHAATPVPRWVLATEVLRLAARLRPASMSFEAFIVVGNAAWSSLALCALAGCARLLARDRREQILVAALACTAFGTLEVAIGYLDVYPVAVAGTALFFWAALRALRGEAHLGWALAIAAVAPFFYIGLVLVWPSAAIALAAVARDPRRRREAASAVAAAVVVAGAATLPLRGLPFDWLGFLASARHGSAFQAGYAPDSSLLPAWYLTSRLHLAELASTVFLVDPVGPLLALVAGAALLAHGWREIDGALLVIAAFVAGWVAYAFAMDAAFGAYADWDLFSFGAVGTSLLGGACLVRAGRDRPAALGAVGGLAVAAAVVHLLARLHALPIEADRHLRESPVHVLRPAGTEPAK
jgi:hypothetical protein